MNRYSMPMLRPNGDGLTVRWKCANSHPEMLASKAARTNAVTLTRKVSIPIASGIVDPPLTARRARPARESSKCVIATAARTTMIQSR